MRRIVFTGGALLIDFVHGSVILYMDTCLVWFLCNLAQYTSDVFVQCCVALTRWMRTADLSPALRALGALDEKDRSIIVSLHKFGARLFLQRRSLI